MTADLCRAWLLVFTCALLWACGGPRSRLLAEADAEGEVAAALALLVELPDWSRTRTCVKDAWFTGDDVRAYVETAQALRAMDPDDVRAAYQIYVDWAAEQPVYGFRHLTNVLFILDRVLFDLPKRVPRATHPYFAEFGREFSTLLNPPEDVVLLYPVIVDDSGAIIDIHTALEGRGPNGAYDAVGAFDHYRATYGFRDPIRYAGDSYQPPSPAPRRGRDACDLN